MGVLRALRASFNPHNIQGICQPKPDIYGTLIETNDPPLNQSLKDKEGVKKGFQNS